AFLLAGDSCPDSLLIYSSLIGVKSNFTILLSLPVSILEMSNEKPGKSIHRTPSIKNISIHSQF
ncbi:hypothetical protein, partial [Planktothrix agardhii]|uniref:hypothetical protein n=1 Tax=Planktothrix agardhii TaxID=1160 RepID=UPI0037852FE4